MKIPTEVDGENLGSNPVILSYGTDCESDFVTNLYTTVVPEY
jgi:hypothetical protein